MPPPIAGVVFDLDGTLVDSRTDIANAANYALGVHALPRHSEEKIGGFVGDGATQLMARAASIPVDSPDLSPILNTFLEYYAVHGCRYTTLMRGTREVLDALRDVPLALLTNKPRRVTIPLLDSLNITRDFRCVIAGGDLPVMKPEPQPLLEIAMRLGIAPKFLMMVGDGPQDVECGRRAGAFTVGVAGGIATPASLIAAKPDRLIASLAELPDLFAEFRNGLDQPARR